MLMPARMSAVASPVRCNRAASPSAPSSSRVLVVRPVAALPQQQQPQQSRAPPTQPAPPHLLQRLAAGALAGVASLSILASGAHARPEGVNRPDLLPKEFSTVIDVAGFLAPSEASIVLWGSVRGGGGCCIIKKNARQPN